MPSHHLTWVSHSIPKSSGWLPNTDWGFQYKAKNPHAPWTDADVQMTCMATTPFPTQQMVRGFFAMIVSEMPSFQLPKVQVSAPDGKSVTFFRTPTIGLVTYS
jgi:hypothetical protein